MHTSHIVMFLTYDLTIDPRVRPQSRPVVITIFTQSVRPSVRPSVPKLQNQATITAGQDCGLAEWIIDDSCLVFLLGTKVVNIFLARCPSLVQTFHMSNVINLLILSDDS